MNLIHLPTLDGSVEASVARLEAMDRRWVRETIGEALDNLIDSAHDLHELAVQAEVPESEWVAADKDLERVRLRVDVVKAKLARLGIWS